MRISTCDCHPVQRWCDNRLAVHGDPERLRALVDALEGNGPFDFERVLAIPESIRDEDRYDPGEALKRFANCEWWCAEHWGAKSRAEGATKHGTDADGAVRYRLFTASGPPLALLDELAARHPPIHFHLAFAIGSRRTGSAAWARGRRVVAARSLRDLCVLL